MQMEIQFTHTRICRTLIELAAFNPPPPPPLPLPFPDP